MRVTCGRVESHFGQAPSHRSGASSNLYCISDWSTLWRSRVISKRPKNIPILHDDSSNDHNNYESNIDCNNNESNTDEYDDLYFSHSDYNFSGDDDGDY